MKKITSKWKSLNKNGLKLSLICGLNWFIGFVAKSQFYLFSAVFAGMLTYYIPEEARQITLDILVLLVLANCVASLVYSSFLQEFRRLKSALYSLALLFFLGAGSQYVSQHTLTESMVDRLLTFGSISFVILLLAKFILPILFNHYLFKNVINKDYLGIRKSTDELPPQSNLYVDADEKDANKRMKRINKNAIKPAYQEVVELSFLNQEVLTGISYKAVPFEKEVERTFIDANTIYYPVFTVHPFGNLKGKSDFYHKLIKLKLSQKAAFTVTGESVLKKDF
ncbi:hypothetical protein [Streptococcus mutans]|uniref:hypothetical protein n=1 Tax=Streptococcus mutans TaxID=1309 RepID=UPI0038BA8D47